MSADRSTLQLAATASLVVSGLSLAVYALGAFTVRDWTVAGPGLIVAIAGIIGLRVRWAYLAGLVPISAVLTIAGRIVAFDLARPGETPYFVGSMIIVVAACFAAVLGVTAVLGGFAATGRGRSRLLPTAIAVAAAGCIGTFAFVVAGNNASAATDSGITEAERDAATPIDMVDYRFVPKGAVNDGGVIHLRNTGALPHAFDVPSLGTSIFVPSGRDTYVRLPRADSQEIGVVCLVGDHQQRGMGLDLPLASDSDEQG